MSDFAWKIAALAAFIIVGAQTVWGWRTGRISYRALDGDRKTSPVIYWFLMGTNTILVVGFLLAVLGIYGEF